MSNCFIINFITIRNPTIFARWQEHLKHIGYEGQESTALANLLNFFDEATRKEKSKT